MSNNFFIVTPNESWNYKIPFQLIFTPGGKPDFFCFKYLSPFLFITDPWFLINMETPNPSNYSVDFAVIAPRFQLRLSFKRQTTDWFIGWNSRF